MAKTSFVIGVLTMSFCMLIYELEPLWLLCDLIGIVLASIGLRKGDKNCKAGLILCSIAGFFCLSIILLILFAKK